MFKKRKEEQRRIEAEIKQRQYKEYAIENLEKYGESLKQLIEIVNSEDIFEGIETFNGPFPQIASLKTLVFNVEHEFKKVVKDSGWLLGGNPTEETLSDPVKKALFLTKFGMNIVSTGHFGNLNKHSDFLTKFLKVIYMEYGQMLDETGVYYLNVPSNMRFSLGDEPKKHITQVLSEMLTDGRLFSLSERVQALAIKRILERKGFFK